MDNHPFDLDNDAAYQHWRDTKRARHPRRAEDLIVDVADPRALSQAERDRLLALCASANESAGPTRGLWGTANAAWSRQPTEPPTQLDQSHRLWGRRSHHESRYG